MKNASGITLIETLTAMALSSFLLLGLMTVFAQTRSVYRDAEHLARIHENLRFAEATLEADIRLANYWGRTHGAGNIRRAAGVSVLCQRRDVSAWALTVSRGVEVGEDARALPCTVNRPRKNSDVLTVRHVRPAPTTPADGGIQLYGNGAQGTLFSHAGALPKQQPGAEIFDLVVNSYYVSDHSNYDADLPALRRLTLVKGVMQDQEIIPGVSHLRARLGLDSNSDGRADLYVGGDDTRLTKPGNRVVSVRLRLIMHAAAPGDRPASIQQTIFLRNPKPTEYAPDSV